MEDGKSEFCIGIKSIVVCIGGNLVFEETRYEGGAVGIDLFGSHRIHLFQWKWAGI